MDRNLISTTDSIKGYDIVDQKGIVSSRAVVGVGFFSEFFAGFTDVFGGRSQKLEDRLGELYQDVLDNLENELIKKNCNAIIGVRCDFDQISGKGTFMFMLSITGTAVNAICNNSISHEQSPIMAIAIGKSIERKLVDKPNIHTVYNVVEDLLIDLKVVSLELFINALSSKPTSEEKIDKVKISKIIDYMDSVYDCRKVSRAFIEKISDTSFEKSKSFYEIYFIYVKPYFEYMVEALNCLDKPNIEKYIRCLEEKPRTDFSIEDAAYIEQYISKLIELGFDVDYNSKDEYFARVYGIKAKTGIGFIKDLKDAIIQYYNEEDQ